MTYLEKLLDGAPVEWRSLGEVCLKTENVRWTALSPETEFQYIDLASVSVLHRQIEDTQVITSETAPSRAQQIVRTDDVLFGATRPTLNRLCVVPPQYDGQICSTGFCILRANRTVLLPRFLFHCLQEPLFQRHVVSNQQGTIYPMISNKRVREFLIPLPPLAVQQQIVEILDKFTALIEALETELALRTRQYAYYRNKLLRFGATDPNVQWCRLGEVADVSKLAGFEFTKYVKYSDIGTIIAIRGLNVKGHLDLSDVKYMDNSNFEKLSRSKLYSGDMLFTYVGTVGNVAIVDEDDRFYLAPNVCRIRFTNGNILPRFMFYYFQTSRFRREQMGFYMEKSTMQNLTMGNIRKFLIPLPPLAVQEQIVAVLDKFHTLVYSLSEGLPAEIALRQQQYRYYRRLLLDFPRS